MRFKLDENLHPEVAPLLSKHGHDATTVWDEDLRGKADPEIAAACLREGRVLITFDLGFSDLRSYAPEKHAGIIVLRLGSQSRAHLLSVIHRVLDLLKQESPVGRLWVVGEQGVRIRGEEEAE